MTRLFTILLAVALPLLGASPAVASSPQRIVSLAPSITETIYALGAGDRIVGVTDFCDYPAEAALKPKVGGFVNTSYEAIVALRPDLVIMLDIDQEEMKRNIETLGIAVVMVKNESAAEVINSIRTIGEAIGAPKRAAEIIAGITATIKSIQKKARGARAPRALVVVTRDYDGELNSGVYVAAPNSYFGDLLTMVGAKNVYTGGVATAKYPRLQGEGFYRLKADYLIDIIPTDFLAGRPPETFKKQWAPLVARGFIDPSRIAILSDQFAVRPGPRIGETLRAIARIIYPDRDF